MAFSKKGKEEAAKAALHSAPEALSELEASQLFTEDPLEALLDEQSDEDFGDLELKERSGKPVKLAEWTAQDFSSIYLRFRPHLERHARRFLRNPSQVDEVVQDAFLYLMVSLPELDSEIGVLRFLKWKTRLLALDVIRASGRAYINSIDDVQEPESNDPEVSSNLEQQDDAAVVRLALSKLNPRHREVLIASMYEEKSTEEIASQVGLSENATRQLIFRARAAFKKALIGDVDTTGMSAAAILSVAARKAASEGKKVGAAALTLIALVVMSLTVFPGLNRATTDQMAEAPVNSGSTDSSSQATGEVSGTEAEVAPTPDSEVVDDSGTNADATPANSNDLSATPSPTPSPKAAKEAIQAVLEGPSPGELYNSNVKSMILFIDQNYAVIGENGLTAKFTFNPTTPAVFGNVSVDVKIDTYSFEFKPTNIQLVSGKNADGHDVYILLGDATYIFDESGKKWSNSDLGKSRIKIEVAMQTNGTTVKSIDLVMLAG
jgi:RNA polymerase sigma-70 factor (ECF subfamily)